MRIGMQGRFYPTPAGLDEEHIGEWQLQRSVELGCTVLQIGHLPKQPDALCRFGELARSLSIELEMSVPGVFDLTSPSSGGEARIAFLEAVRRAKLLGMPVIRTGYGRLTAETSRFNRRMAVQEHLHTLVPSLKEAAAIVRDADVLLAVENHCDFSGRELAQLLDQLDSPYVGAALDTANGFTVFCDPNEDVEALAPYSFTTHIKDMAVVDFRSPGNIPLTAYGCALGEGHVDLPRALQLLAAYSPRADGLHLIIEPGWMKFDPERSAFEQGTQFFAESIRYLQQLKIGVSA